MQRILFALAFVGLMIASGDAGAADLLWPQVQPVNGRAPLWSGAYVGANVGYGWGHGKDQAKIGGFSVLLGSDNMDGVLGGGQIGYNWQITQFVFGAEADFQATGQSHTTGTTVSVTNSIPWFGTVRGRLGYAGTGYLAYATAGLAYGRFETKDTIPGASLDVSTNWTGWTIGGGVEVALREHWTAKVEYLFIDTGDFVSASLTVPGASTVTDNLSGYDHVARVGVNYWW